jgi:hypothetical protein
LVRRHKEFTMDVTNATPAPECVERVAKRPRSKAASTARRLTRWDVSRRPASPPMTVDYEPQTIDEWRRWLKEFAYGPSAAVIAGTMLGRVPVEIKSQAWEIKVEHCRTYHPTALERANKIAEDRVLSKEAKRRRITAILYAATSRRSRSQRQLARATRKVAVGRTVRHHASTSSRSSRSGPPDAGGSDSPPGDQAAAIAAPRAARVPRALERALRTITVIVLLGFAALTTDRSGVVHHA